jgi:transmembrane sensor
MEPERPLNWEALRKDTAEVERAVDWEKGLRGARARFLLTAQRPPNSKSWLVSARAAFAVAACLIAVFGWAGYRRTAPISFNAGANQAPGRIGELLYSPGSQSVPVRFSDGTSLSMAASTRARVTATTAHGATVVLEDGALSVAVVHRDAARWYVAAGPFTVLVTGTKFDVHWSTADETLSLALHEGSVTVVGPSLGSDGRRILPGQTLRVSVPRPRSAAVEPPPTSAVEAAAPAATRDPGAKISDDEPKATSHGSWKSLALEGRYADALAAAEAEGFEGVCRRASSEDLLLLGYTSRFAGSVKRAEQALELVQTRPSGKHEAAMSAFTLGRIAYDDRQNYRDAARWFQRYLREEPSGDLAREAAGRLIEAQKAAGDLTAARESASAYLTQYPAGPYAGLARAVLGP